MTLATQKELFQPSLPPHLMQSLRVTGCESRNWKLRVPGSKSVTNRALVLAGLAGRSVELLSPLLADDTWWGFQALEELGFRLDVSQLPERVFIEIPERSAKKNVSLYLGQSGTLARFLPALLLNWKTVSPDSSLNSFFIDADAQLKKRPLTPLIHALRSLGAYIDAEHMPMHLQPSELQGHARIDGSQSGQFVSGLLLAAAGSRRTCRISRVHHLVQPDYVRITLAMLKEFGAQVVHDPELHEFSILPGAWDALPHYTIEADASTACYFAALACVLGAELKIENLGSATLQPDFQFMSLLQRFGFLLHWNENECFVSRSPNLIDASRDEILNLDMSACSDQALTAGVMSLCTGRGVRVSGVAHIRNHESDRVASFCANVRALGVAVQENIDGFVVPSGCNAASLRGDWPTHNDHRFALAGIVLAACAPQVSILEPGCIKKTAPGFVQMALSLGVRF